MFLKESNERWSERGEYEQMGINLAAAPVTGNVNIKWTLSHPFGSLSAVRANYFETNAVDFVVFLQWWLLIGNTEFFTIHIKYFTMDNLFYM